MGPDQFTCQQLDQCLQNNGGCQQVCSTTDVGPVCSCNQGFVLQRDRRTCAAAGGSSQSCRVNNGGCQHFCGNVRGGRRCFCSSGFELQADGVSCLSQSTVQTCNNNNGGCQQVSIYFFVIDLR